MSQWEILEYDFILGISRDSNLDEERGESLLEVLETFARFSEVIGFLGEHVYEIRGREGRLGCLFNEGLIEVHCFVRPFNEVEVAHFLFVEFLLDDSEQVLQHWIVDGILRVFIEF